MIFIAKAILSLVLGWHIGKILLKVAFIVIIVICAVLFIAQLLQLDETTIEEIADLLLNTLSAIGKWIINVLGLHILFLLVGIFLRNFFELQKFLSERRIVIFPKYPSN